MPRAGEQAGNKSFSVFGEKILLTGRGGYIIIIATIMVEIWWGYETEF